MCYFKSNLKFQKNVAYLLLLITIISLCKHFLCPRSRKHSMNSFLIPSDMESILHHIKSDESVLHPLIHILSYKITLRPTNLCHTLWFHFVSHKSELNQMNSYLLQISLVFLWSNIFGICYCFNLTTFWLLFQCITKTLKRRDPLHDSACCVSQNKFKRRNNCHRTENFWYPSLS